MNQKQRKKEMNTKHKTQNTKHVKISAPVLPAAVHSGQQGRRVNSWFNGPFGIHAQLEELQPSEYHDE
jgi:hypothetical protein